MDNFLERVKDVAFRALGVVGLKGPRATPRRFSVIGRLRSSHGLAETLEECPGVVPRLEMTVVEGPFANYAFEVFMWQTESPALIGPYLVRSYPAEISENRIHGCYVVQNEETERLIDAVKHALRGGPVRFKFDVTCTLGKGRPLLSNLEVINAPETFEAQTILQ